MNLMMSTTAQVVETSVVNNGTTITLTIILNLLLKDV